jgi:predicted RNA binding protein YcfA (HicA-like mRNA interferase family)
LKALREPPQRADSLFRPTRRSRWSRLRSKNFNCASRTSISQRPPALKPATVLWALQRAHIHHTKGSHYYLNHPHKPQLLVTLLFHGTDLKGRRLTSIIQQAAIPSKSFSTFSDPAVWSSAEHPVAATGALSCTKRGAPRFRTINQRRDRRTRAR